jgi:HD-GYP domain-containing protein (c-di-GMP phosphodiesterase class II)
VGWNQLSQSSLAKVNHILNDVKAYDESTFLHCQRVGELSLFLAQAAGLEESEQLLAHISGLLHDVGKIKIPIEVLNKPGKLTDEEYRLVKNHAQFSAELIEDLADDPFFREVQLAVLHHHERVDGQGYPAQLEKEEIPLISRIILIVDTVDAMTRTRAYRKGLPMSVVYKELEKFAGQQFDAELVSVFMKAHKEFVAKTPQAQVIPLARKRKAA